MDVIFQVPERAAGAGETGPEGLWKDTGYLQDGPEMEKARTNKNWAQES